MAVKRAVFLDKDGTLLVDAPYNVDPARMVLAPGVAEGLAALGESDRLLIVISNQPGVALGRFEPEALHAVSARLRCLCEAAGATLTDLYFCPHHPRGTVAAYTRACDCRKPQPGLLLRAASEYGIDLAASWFVGDILDDVEAGRRAGVRTVLLDVGNETEWRTGPWRLPHRRVPDFRSAVAAILAGEDRTAGHALAAGAIR